MFAFRFDTLLDQRRHAEDALQLELAEARQALAAEQAAWRDAKQAINQCRRDLHRAQQERFRADEILLYPPYLERLQQAIEAQARRVAAAERRVLQKRHALVEAMKKRKILEKLREKHAREHQRGEAAREQRAHEEAAAQQYQRR
ncbi:MAG: flagellar export protein FliJ [Desulfobacterales bacterium]|jgi:flagellar FliJ protein|nr:flagellar export protein FliJ [Desulfobacterales bacterium]